MLLAATPLVHAAAPEAFAVSNRSPLVQIFGLPTVQPPLRFNEFEAVLSEDITSNYIVTGNARESLVLDGETYRSMLRFRRGHANGITFGIELPHLRHSGGHLDEFILDFHNAFGFPQGGRNLAVNDSLTYRYARNGVTPIQVMRSGGGIGDVQLSAAMPLRPTRWVQTTLKLPTGDSARLFGSGGTDFSLALHARAPLADTVGGYAGAGLLLMTRGEVLPQQQKPAVAFGHVGAAWQMFERVGVQAQLDGHTAFYGDSDIAALGSDSLQLTLGTRIAITRATALTLALVEDVAVATAPDATFHLQLLTRY